jgi:hypothetical protein
VRHEVFHTETELGALATFFRNFEAKISFLNKFLEQLPAKAKAERNNAKNLINALEELLEEAKKLNKYTPSADIMNLVLKSEINKVLCTREEKAFLTAATSMAFKAMHIKRVTDAEAKKQSAGDNELFVPGGPVPSFSSSGKR